MRQDQISERARFDIIRYANCWEDADILCDALQPAPERRILSIASAGDNALAMLAEGATVVAADLSPAQLACVEIRCAAFRNMDYPEILAFLGIKAMPDRLDAYHELRSDLSPQARDFWDANPEQVKAGIVHFGKFESYFRLFRTRVIPLIHSRRDIDALLTEKPVGAQEEFYEKTWNNLRWRLCFKIFFSRWMMARFGRDPEFFRYVEGSVADRILERARHGFTAVPVHSNPYLNYILTGNFPEHALPRYLQPERFEPIRSNLDRLQLHQGPIEEAAKEYADNGWDGFNLSDIFEYVNTDTARAIYKSLLDKANPLARFAYWNMLVPRRCPSPLREKVQSLEQRSQKLFLADKAFFYSAFVLEEVT